MKKPKREYTVGQINAAHWHYDKAIRFWLAGKWDEYAYHAKTGDQLLGYRYAR